MILSRLASKALNQINALGYGLMRGQQARIASRAQAVAARAQVGNIYINRNMIGEKAPGMIRSARQV